MHDGRPGLQAAGRATPDVSRQPAGDVSTSAANARWETLFEDETLRDLIAAALEHNYDVRIAATRILQAQAQLGITRSNQFPTVDAVASGQGQRTPITSSEDDARTVGVMQLGASVGWEPDFWGKFRRANESARAQILASEWGRRAIVTSLISQVASGYFALRALDLELAVSTRTGHAAGIPPPHRGPRGGRRDVARGRPSGRAARAGRGSRSSIFTG